MAMPESDDLPFDIEDFKVPLDYGPSYSFIVDNPVPGHCDSGWIMPGMQAFVECVELAGHRGRCRYGEDRDGWAIEWTHPSAVPVQRRTYDQRRHAADRARALKERNRPIADEWSKP